MRVIRYRRVASSKVRFRSCIVATMQSSSIGEKQTRCGGQFAGFITTQTTTTSPASTTPTQRTQRSRTTTPGKRTRHTHAATHSSLRLLYPLRSSFLKRPQRSSPVNHLLRTRSTRAALPSMHTHLVRTEIRRQLRERHTDRLTPQPVRMNAAPLVMATHG